MAPLPLEAHFTVLAGTIGPRGVGGVSENVEDAVELVEIVSAREEGVAEVEFDDDAGKGEDVDETAVLLGSQQVLGGTVPTRGHIVSSYFFKGYG